jgi:DNA-binding response OmpR family regulator
MKNCILVIEDCQMMRSFVSQLLKRNYEVVSCESAETALNWLSKHNKPDLILTDYGLVDMDGLQFIKEVRKQRELGDTPIIMLSGAKDSSYRLKTLEAGANDYLTKPFHPRELELRIELNIESAKQNALLKKIAEPTPKEQSNISVNTQEVGKNISFLQRFRTAFTL